MMSPTTANSLGVSRNAGTGFALVSVRAEGRSLQRPDKGNSVRASLGIQKRTPPTVGKPYRFANHKAWFLREKLSAAKFSGEISVRQTPPRQDRSPET